MKGSFTITGRLPGLNEIVGANRSNRYAGASQKKKETQRCQWAIIAGGVPAFKSPVMVSVVWTERDLRRDPDNICAGIKFIMDSLVELGKIPNDTREWIKGISHEFAAPSRDNPKIEVTIEEVSNA